MSDDLIYPYPGKVLRLNTRQMEMPAMMDLLKSTHMMDPTMLDERTPFFWSAEISNGKVDSFFTHMLDSTLTNFVADANAGVAFLRGHRHDELPIGQSLAGRMVNSGSVNAVHADFFTLPGLELNEFSTDDLIAGIRGGLIKDISVGFSLGSGSMWCDICKMDYRSYDCPHMAGMKYDIQGQGQVPCTVGIDGAHLAEVSAVYDGATPDATILKAQRMSEDGTLPPKVARALETRYRTKLFDTKRTFAGVSIPERKKKMEVEQQIKDIREVLGLKEEDDVVTAVMTTHSRVAALSTVEKEAETLRAKVAELTPQASEGVAYRLDLVTSALAEGVRAMGATFNAKTYENVLKTAPLDVVKQMKADWERVGNANFPGGRLTNDDNGEAPDKTKAVKAKTAYVPPAAYKS